MSDLTITISLEEYRDLIDTQARVSILRTNMVSDLRKCIEEQKETNRFGGYCGVSNSHVDWEKVSNVLGFLPTFNGFYEQEQKLIKESNE